MNEMKRRGRGLACQICNFQSAICNLKKRRSSRGKEERGERNFEGCRSDGNAGRPRDRGKVPRGSEPKAHGGWALGRGTWQIIPTNLGLRGRPFCSGSSSFFLA